MAQTFAERNKAIYDLAQQIDLDGMFAERGIHEYVAWVMAHHRDVTFEQARDTMNVLTEQGKLVLTNHYDLVRK